jgi:SulP family sulfate permease
MIDWRALSYHWRASRFDAAIIDATAISAVAISVEFCVLIGVLMSFMLTVPRAGRMLLTEFVVTDEGGIHERLADDLRCDRILIFGLEGELFFGASSALEAHFAAIERRVSEHTEFIVLRVKRTRNPDAVGVALLEDFLDRLEERGVRVLLCGVRSELVQKFVRTGSIERLRDRVFLEQPVRQTSTQLAVRHAYQHLASPCERCPRRDAATRTGSFYYAV